MHALHVGEREHFLCVAGRRTATSRATYFVEMMYDSGWIAPTTYYLPAKVRPSMLPQRRSQHSSSLFFVFLTVATAFPTSWLFTATSQKLLNILRNGFGDATSSLNCMRLHALLPLDCVAYMRFCSSLASAIPYFVLLTSKPNR